jgi:hypothetical protein
MTDSIEKDDDVQEPVKSRRDQAMDDLIEKRKNDMAPEPEPEPEPEIKTIDLIGEDGNPIKVPINAKYKAKVDGDEIEVDFEKLTRSYQVGSAADKRLKAASEKIKEIEQREQALAAKQQAISDQEKAYLESQKNLDDRQQAGTITDEKYKELSKKLLSAITDEDNPEDAIESVLKEMAPKNIDTDAIDSTYEKKALEAIEKREQKRQEDAEKARLERLEKARIEANERFEAALDTDFKLLKEDPDLMQLAKSYANRAYHEDPDADPWTVITSAHEKVVEFKKRMTGTSKKPPATPKSTSARASIGEDKKPKTRGDIINEMRTSRGQPAIG